MNSVLSVCPSVYMAITGGMVWTWCSAFAGDEVGVVFSQLAPHLYTTFIFIRFDLISRFYSLCHINKKRNKEKRERI